MSRTSLSAIIAASAIALTWCVAGGDNSGNADPFNQRNFPCNEDEVLGYAPTFGPNRVGCIHIDELTRQPAL